jgi:hypothetical protein
MLCAHSYRLTQIGLISFKEWWFQTNPFPREFETATFHCREELQQLSAKAKRDSMVASNTVKPHLEGAQIIARSALP